MSHDIGERFEKARREAQQQIDSGLIQGAVFTRNHADGKIMALGLQTVHPETKPMTEHSRFDIASVGKVFTASCCARLIAAGQLDPDAPFTRYLPEHVLGKSCEITVRDLATHASGFDNAKPYESADLAVFERELMRKMPVRPRRTAFEYSCYNFILLGRIAERVSGLDLDRLARKSIWAPLGMDRTQWLAPGDGPDEVEHWFPNRPAGSHNDTVCFYSPGPLGSGSCFSTARDMLLFLDDLLERKHFEKEYHELLMTCAFERNASERRSFGWDMCAARRPKNFSDRAIFHSGWSGQTVCVDPENDFAGVVLTSRTGDWEEAYAGRSRILEILAGV